MSQPRSIRQIIPSQPTSDGDGVKIRRIPGFNTAGFSPFLMLDELKGDDKKDYVGGFPPHPHRGLETLTYMLNGDFEHRDHMGNVGALRSGGAQWMAAGRGVIHSEMPMMEDGKLHGFQIWINQPAALKMTPAQYHDFQPETITEFRQQDLGLLRVLAGHFTLGEQTLTGPLTKTGAVVNIADWQSGPGDQLQLTTEQSHNAMVYVYKGSISIAGKPLMAGELALLSAGDVLDLAANDTVGALIFAGQPLNEPVVHYGPFVMNTFEEIEQAINDYNSGVFSTY